MIQRQLVLPIVISVFLIIGAGEAGEPSVSPQDQIMERYRSLLLSEKPPEVDTVQRYADQISETGTWPDIDYASRSRAGWRPCDHLSRVQLMALALATQEHTQQVDEKLRRVIGLALDHWCAKRYRSSNWWFNEIGVPRVMRDIVALLGDDLGDDRRNAAIEVIGQHKMRGAGANLMWSAELSLHHGCLTGNREQIARAAKQIWTEVKVGKDDLLRNSKTHSFLSI